MEIRKKLLYQFIAIVALILLFSSLSIYISFSEGRKEEFYDRLSRKAKMVAQMLIEIDDINIELLKRIEKNNPVTLPNEKIVIYDFNDQIVYSTDENKFLNITHQLLTVVKQQKEIRLKQDSYEILGHFYTGKDDTYVVFSAATDIYGLAKLKRLKISLFVVFLISMVVVFISGRIFVSKALTPISDIITQVDEIGVLNLDSRISEGNGKDELARLAQTFNKMLERIEAAFKSQKNFIANASHELRTPLTVITGQLEVILMNNRRNEEYKHAIVSALGNIKNLNNISNRLLQLAQASAEFSETDFSPVRIDEILWISREDILKIHDDYQISINFSDSIDDEIKLMVKGNEQLLITALGNIIDNGCKYSENKSVEISVYNQDDSVIIVFSDQGIGIPEDDIEMIFQPFFRSGNALGTKGHGIGLSLVEKIVTLHKGKITVKSELMKGSSFTLALPLIVTV